MEIIGRDERIRTSDPLTPRVWGSLPVPVYHRIGRFERRIFDVFGVHRGDRELGGEGELGQQATSIRSRSKYRLPSPVTAKLAV